MSPLCTAIWSKTEGTLTLVSFAKMPAAYASKIFEQVMKRVPSGLA